MLSRRCLPPALLTGLLFFASCRDREITVYRAPKDPAPAAMPSAPAAAPGALPPGHPAIGDAGPAGPPGDMAGTVPTADGADLTWTAPPNWLPKALGPMRKGSYTIPGDGAAAADLAITAFPGDTGGLFANVNRWRGQVGLPPIEESQLEANLEHLTANGLQIDLVDLLGTVNGQPTRLLGAIIPHNGGTWFFKLLGPDAIVTREKPAMREFLNSIKARTP